MVWSYLIIKSFYLHLASVISKIKECFNTQNSLQIINHLISFALDVTILRKRTLNYHLDLELWYKQLFPKLSYLYFDKKGSALSSMNKVAHMLFFLFNYHYRYWIFQSLIILIQLHKALSSYDSVQPRPSAAERKAPGPSLRALVCSWRGNCSRRDKKTSRGAMSSTPTKTVRLPSRWGTKTSRPPSR